MCVAIVSFLERMFLLGLLENQLCIKLLRFNLLCTVLGLTGFILSVHPLCTSKKYLSQEEIQKLVMFVNGRGGHQEGRCVYVYLFACF